jgi:hypothetical protein
MTRGEYCATVRELFTHFYHLHGTAAEKLPASKIDPLFDFYAAPKQMCEVIFVNDDHRR